MKAGLKSDSLAPLHYFSVVHESIAWSSCSSAELASSLIHEAKLTLSYLNLLLLKTKTLHFVLESTNLLYLSYWYLWNYTLLRFGKLEILFPKIDMMVGDYYENIPISCVTLSVYQETADTGCNIR